MCGEIKCERGGFDSCRRKSIPVENHGYFWSERQPQSGDYVDFGGEKREVRFYLRIGKNTQLKLQDTIYSQNLPQRTLSESGLEAITELGTGALKVSGIHTRTPIFIIGWKSQRKWI